MWSKLTFLTAVVLLLGMVSSASATTQIKVDLVNKAEGDPWPNTFKGGDWIAWPAWNDDESDEAHDAANLIGVGDTDINIGLASLCCQNVFETSDGGEEKICNSWLENYYGGDTADISLVIWGPGLEAGQYRVYAYHNDAENSRAVMPYIHVGTYCDANKVGNIDAPTTSDCNGVVQISDWETFDQNVPVQNLSGAAGLDDSLIPSLVKFYTDGSPVLITYASGDGSNAIINAFIIETVGAQVTAWKPTPKHGTTDLCAADVTLTWTPGIKAQDVNAHEIYFGTSHQLVSDANISEPCGVYMGAQDWDSNTYPELGGLDLQVGTTYYWRIDEVNESDPNVRWKGAVWQFTTHSGEASDPIPSNNHRGIQYSSLTLLEWTPSCVADDHKVYLGEDLPANITLMEDNFEGPGGIDTNQWDSTAGWALVNAHGDANYGRDSNIVEADGTGEILESNAVDLSDACAFNVRFDVNLTKGLSPSAELQLLYWNGSSFIEVADWNYVDANDHNNAWFRFRRTLTRAEAPQYLINGFKFQLKTVNLDKPVYVDNPRIRNTWPAAAKWYDGRTAEPNYPISLQPFKKCYWR
ncbi:MAG: hypothetical protein ACYSR4_03445, partial [Planctomycetota bacterium]